MVRPLLLARRRKLCPDADPNPIEFFSPRKGPNHHPEAEKVRLLVRLPTSGHAGRSCLGPLF